MKTPIIVLSALLLSAGAIAQETAKQPIGDPSSRLPAGESPSLPSFESLDTNADGRISATEAQASPMLASNFSTIDKQGKGYIAKEEYQAFVRSAPRK